jgi:NADH:ubiquinone reductase (H+-translocating)
MSKIFHDARPPPAEASRSRDGNSVATLGSPRVARKRIVIVGAGFAGIASARALKRADADIVLIDRRNHHIFQPLLYQVATAVLAPSEIAAPIRQLAKDQKNLSVILGIVVGVESVFKRLNSIT